jgi:hypothetical protein
VKIQTNNLKKGNHEIHKINYCDQNPKCTNADGRNCLCRGAQRRENVGRPRVWHEEAEVEHIIGKGIEAKTEVSPPELWTLIIKALTHVKANHDDFTDPTALKN